ncbi:hypothetical protein QZH41_000915 [Actinostola sp. cb2023]|nr:hypothetical protein QZH41_000915 [Actinostola sp. cb2023]
MAGKYYEVVTGYHQQENCHRVDVVFDQYWHLSIKAGERKKRGETSALEVKIHGSSTPVPKQWPKYISNVNNKVSLCAFLTESWCEMGKRLLQSNKELVIGGGMRDGVLALSIKNDRCVTVEELNADHEEADTRMLLHAEHASQDGQRIVIQSPDTDVLILCVSHYDDIGCEELWFRTGVKDRLRYIPAHKISLLLGPRMCKVLPAFHAVTGCDSTSALSGIGKKKAWKMISKSKEIFPNTDADIIKEAVDDSITIRDAIDIVLEKTKEPGSLLALKNTLKVLEAKLSLKPSIKLLVDPTDLVSDAAAFYKGPNVQPNQPLRISFAEVNIVLERISFPEKMTESRICFFTYGYDQSILRDILKDHKSPVLLEILSSCEITRGKDEDEDNQAPPSTDSDPENEEEEQWTDRLTDFQIPDFQMTAEIRFPLPAVPKEIDFFSAFFGDDLSDQIVAETNRYARQKLTTAPDRLAKFTEVTRLEIKAYFGV